MKAINLLTYKESNVLKYQNIKYMDFDIEGETNKYFILEVCDYKLDTVDEGHLYLHYTIDGKLYSWFYTNDFVPFAQKQIDIWELI